MKSPLRSLKGWFSGNSRRRARKNRAPRRRLRLEPLETRQLLTADLAAVAGTVFVDLTDDGLTADDTRLEGVTVNLYRDGGDEQFEGDTTLLESVVSNAAGRYRFDNLSPGLYFVEQEAADGLLQRPEESVHAVWITAEDTQGLRDASIDSFGVTAQSVRVSSPAPANESKGVPAPEALGGHRNLFIELHSGSAVEMRVMDLDPPFFSFNSFAGAVGRGVITWDGGGAPDQLDPTGLDSFDLTKDGSAFGMAFLQGADLPRGEIRVHVYSDADNYSTFASTIPETPGGEAVVNSDIWFRDFEVARGQGADFQNVGAIQMEIQGVAAMDAQIKNLGMFGPTIKTVNFANLNPLSLGDTVWFDEDNNGFLDPGEIGIPGVALTLYEDTDGSGDFTPGVDVERDSQVTDSDGLYLFTGLFPGDYIVRVDPENFQPGAALHEMVSSTAFETPPNPNNNVDGDDNGYPLDDNHEEYGVVSWAINLSAGGEPVEQDGNPNTNLTLDFGFTHLADLEVVKTGVPNPVSAGDQLTYTVTVTNNGPSPAANVELTDTLPEGVTFDAAQSDPRLVANADELTADLGALPVGGSIEVIIVVTVDSGFAGNALLNMAAVASGTPDPDLANNTDNETTDVVQNVNLAIAKSADLAQAIAGEQLVYTLQVTNDGPSDATGVTVEDTLPAEVTYVSATNNHGAVTEANGVVTAGLGNLPAGETKNFEITVLVNRAARDDLTNVAVVTANEDPTEVTDNVVTLVIAQADLGITKTGDPSEVVAGEQLVYTLQVTNHGPSDATGVTVTDTLPAGVSFVATDRPQDSAIGGNTLTVSIGDLPVDGSVEFEVTVDVAPDTRGILENQARVEGNEPDPVPENDEANVQTPVRAKIDLVIEKNAADSVVAGQDVTYTLTVTNQGPSQATGVTVTDVLPGGLTYVSGTTTQGEVSQTNGTMTAVLGEMDPGDVATITFTTTVAQNVSGSILNTSVVAGQEPETNPADNADTHTIQVTPPVNADVAITKQVSPNPVVAGEQLTYTLTVTNNGPSEATDVQVQDQLPDGLTFDAANSTSGLDHAAGRVTANVGNLAPGEQHIITIGAQVSPAARGTLTNAAEVTATEPDSVPANNTANAVTTIIAQADLEITKTNSDPNPAPDDALIYTLNVTNHGPSTATNVTVQDTLPSGVNYVSADNDPAFIHNAGIVTINVGGLGVGENRQFDIHTQVQPGFEGRLVNSAQVWADEHDPDPTNNRADVTSNVAAQASSLSGFVYVDANDDGVMQPDELRLPGVTIHLTGTARNGESISEQTTTDDQGAFRFPGLPAGIYNLRQEPPAGYFRGQNTHDPAVSVAGIDDDEFLGINLQPSETAEDFLFGHRTPVFSKRLFLSSRYH